MDIKRISPGKVEFADGMIRITSESMLAAFLSMHHANADNAQNHSQDVVTEDIDYELVEPLKLPPSNTNDNADTRTPLE